MPYTEAQKRSHIHEIQSYLYTLATQDARIPTVIPDGIYGPETVRAVQAFQKIYSLPVTGEVDRPTWDAIVAAYRKQTAQPEALSIFPSAGYVLREGDSGTLVYIVQAMLNDIGSRYDNLAPVKVTGSFSAATTNAIRGVQQVAGLPQTGAVNRETWNWMVAALNL
ncbi:peptidoglycan-binding protein [Ruminococcus sp.]|uniref:peptidoglycan-binding domain-containing protein n=1 Tax=Ruminococcus sp. TaxID=41978 RepID=UPI0025DF198C|nr:peptidoglycan-binding protein [Ruminococcus sp.]MCI5816418.1 peptidoglycan-binding protein [Ruminococcus sp.]MDD7555155.1 peptidoglycan-binding protein [Ruminococcus sp.]MDY4963177.1 peptidoglycan-binding protein [Ruminococcus callidus]